MEYKESSNQSKNILEQSNKLTKDEEEQLTIKAFDEQFPLLQKYKESSDVSNFNYIADIIFNQFTGKYQSIFPHAIETGFVSFVVDMFLDEESEFTPKVLNLLVGIFNSPDFSTTEYILKNTGFTEQLSNYLSFRNPEILGSALTILGSLFYDCKKLKMEMPIKIDPDTILEIPAEFPELTELTLRTVGYIIDISSTCDEKGIAMNHSISLIRNDIKLNAILSSYRNAIIEFPQLVNALAHDFVVGPLIDIAAPIEASYEDLALHDVMMNNSIDGLNLLITIIEHHKEAGEEILNTLPYDYLVDIEGKDDTRISLIYELISFAIPSRSWMFRLLIDYRVIFNLPDILDRGVFKLRLAAIKLLNTIFRNAPKSMYEDLFDDLFNERFIEIIIEFVQSDKFDLSREVILTMFNICTIAPAMNKANLIMEFKCEEVGDRFEEIEMDTTIPQEEKPLEQIEEIKSIIDSLDDDDGD